jgi:hypothetical protein
MSNEHSIKKIPYDKNSNLFSTSLIFEQNINTLWLYLKDLNSIINVMDFFENLQFKNGNNTWNEGNIFSFNWIGLTHIEGKCIGIKSTCNKKIIIWKAKGDIGISFYKTLCLYRITENNKTLVKSIISRTENKNELIDFNASRNYYVKTEFNILENTSKLLNNIKKDTISYESCIVNVNYLKVWEFITDLKKLSEIAPIIGSKIEYSGEKLKVGSFIKYYIDAIGKTVFFKITGVKATKKMKNWIYKLEAIGVNVKNIPIYIENKVTIIDENKTQLSLLHKFSYNTDQKFFKFFSINKKEIIKKYVKFLENTK